MPYSVRQEKALERALEKVHMVRSSLLVGVSFHCLTFVTIYVLLHLRRLIRNAFTNVINIVVIRVLKYQHFCRNDVLFPRLIVGFGTK